MRMLLTATFSCVMLPSVLLPPRFAPKNPTAVLSPPALSVQSCDLGTHAENAQSTFKLPLWKEMQERNPELSQSNSAVPALSGAEQRGLQSALLRLLAVLMRREQQSSFPWQQLLKESPCASVSQVA